jgi:uncharacterized membrane protein YsdA (DUF1294 family)
MFKIPFTKPAVLIFLAVSLLMSLSTFIIYGIDKSKARKNGEGSRKWRIPEKSLIALAFIFGAPGAAIGMLFFHHKTRKTKFIVLVPAAVVLWIGELVAIIMITK